MFIQLKHILSYCVLKYFSITLSDMKIIKSELKWLIVVFFKVEKTNSDSVNNQSK